MAIFDRQSRASVGDGWLDRFVEGDRDVIEQVYRDTFERVRRAAGQVLREPADRDSVVQQVYADLVSDRALRVGYKGGNLSAYLAAVARHRALDLARRERRLVALSAAEEPTSERGPLDDFRHEIERFAERLPAERRRVVQLRFLLGLTQVEAAAQLGVPRSTLEDWERQIKRLLADHLLGGAKP